MSHINVPERSAQTKKKVKLKRPSRYKVLLINDNYTTMEFVVSVLTNIFGKTPAEATDIMMKVHNEGRGVAGIYAYDIALTKKKKTESEAARNGFPLKCTLEKE